MDPFDQSVHLLDSLLQGCVVSFPLSNESREEYAVEIALFHLGQIDPVTLTGSDVETGTLEPEGGIGVGIYGEETTVHLFGFVEGLSLSNKVSEDFQHGRIASVSQRLRMPLHTQDRTVGIGRNGFDDTIWREGDRLKTRSYILDGLMVGRVYG